MHIQNDQINSKQKSTKGMTEIRERREGKGEGGEPKERCKKTLAARG
jgi:hypothetical protein